MLSIRGWEILGLGRNSLLFAVSFCGFCSSHVLEQVPSDGLKFGNFLWKTATHEMLHQKKMGGIGLKGGWEPKHAEEGLKQVLFLWRFINKHGYLYFINNTYHKTRSAFWFVISSFLFTKFWTNKVWLKKKKKSLQGWHLAAFLHLHPRTDPSYRKMMMQNPIFLHHIPQRILFWNHRVSHTQMMVSGPWGTDPGLHCFIGMNVGLMP